MKLEILGCSGGIGGGRGTSSFLIDEDILIDAGTGLSRLEPERMARIRHVFFTHSHLDHIAGIPLLLVSILECIRKPLVLHGSPETLAALQEHIFNWLIWPDFSVLPDREHGKIRLHPILPGEVAEIGGRKVEPIPVNHVVPTVGYRVESAAGVFAFSGDTTSNDSFWQVLNAGRRLDVLIVESTFTNADLPLSLESRHYCPNLLAEDLKKLRHMPRLYISHLQVGREDAIMAECSECIDRLQALRLEAGDVIELPPEESVASGK